MSDDTELRAPRDTRELFFAFNRLALQGFGGVLPVAQRELVERQRWLTREQFLETLSVGQVLPGPNIINMALIMGDRWFGWRGIVAAIGGLLIAPLIIVLLLAALYSQFASIPWVAGALRGMGAVAAGLIISTGIKLSATLKSNPMGVPVCIAVGVLTLLAIGWLRWPLAWVVLGLGSLCMAYTWRKLGP